MKSITIIESDQFGFESFLGVFGSEAAAIDRVEMLIH